jgi:DNA polymerase-3 subunit delta
MEIHTTINDIAVLEKTLRDLQKSRESLPSCFLLYGEEEYLLREFLQRLVTVILPPGDRDLNLFVIEGENENIDSLCESLMTPPLITGEKVVLLKNTRLFHTRRVLAELVQRIRDRFENDPERAAGDFMEFLRITGWDLGDLRDGGWKKITDEDWQKTVEGDSGEDRERWLSAMVEHCVGRDMEVRGSADDTERLCDVLQSGLPGGNRLIITAETVDARKKLFKIISRIGKVFHFPELKRENVKRRALVNRAREVLAKSGKKLTDEAWSAIGRKTGFDLPASMEAMEMLIMFTGERTLIEEEDVEAAIGRTKEDTVFDLTNALVERDTEKALSSLKNLFEQGVHHLRILGMMAREIRLLLHAKMLIGSGNLSSFRPDMDFGQFQKQVYPLIREWSQGMGKKGSRGDLVEQRPYVIYNALRNSTRFPEETLLRCLEGLVSMDIAFKSTGRNPEILLERFVVDVCMEKKN